MPHTPAASRDRLIDHLVGGNLSHPLTGELSSMLASSSRFLVFADAHRDKIRKKLRTAGDAEALTDVRTELRVAHLLLGDRRFELAFEEGAARSGGPDFAVRYRSARPVACEVTRMRRPPTEVRDAGPVLTKLRQLRPSIPNVLIIAIDGQGAEELDVEGGVRWLRQRADAKDEAFFVRHGFTGAHDFYARFLRLSAVITWCEGAAGEASASAWTNRSTRIAVPERALQAMVAAMRCPASHVVDGMKPPSSASE
jgi:hypothetical protein